MYKRYQQLQTPIGYRGKHLNFILDPSSNLNFVADMLPWLTHDIATFISKQNSIWCLLQNFLSLDWTLPHYTHTDGSISQKGEGFRGLHEHKLDKYIS